MSRLPMVAIEEGYSGRGRVGHAIPYAEAPVEEECSPCRVLVRDRHVVEAGAEALLAAKERQAEAREIAEPRKGRPAALAHLKGEIERLRAQGLSWTQVGQRLHVNPQAARMVVIERKNRPNK